MGVPEHASRGFELAGSEDMEIPRCVSTVEEAIELVRPHYEAWERRQHD